MSVPHPDLSECPFGPDLPFTRRHAAHLLNRAGFCAAAVDVDEVMALGPQRAVDRLLDFPDASAEQQDSADVPDLTGLRDFPTSFDALEVLFDGVGERDARLLRGQMIDANRAALLNLTGWWLNRMAAARHPLQEKLTLFWHGHFTTSSYEVWSTRMLWEQNELLRRGAAGDFAPLLRGICHDPAMLVYLDNASNRSEAPNENFARELMELFTLGIGNYTEDDVRAVARAFTGWSHDGERFCFRPEHHDGGEMTLLGESGQFDGDDVVDLLLRRPACATFVAKRLFEFFVRAPVEPALAVALGEVYRASNLNARALLRTVFNSRAFYDSRAMGTQVKSPLQLLMGTIRLLDVPMPQTTALREQLKSMGQIPFLPPDVNGWPRGQDWINTTRLFCRQNAMVWLAGMARPDVPAGVAAGLAGDRVDYWLDRLPAVPIAADKRQALIDLCSSATRGLAGERELIELILTMPEFQMT